MTDPAIGILADFAERAGRAVPNNLMQRGMASLKATPETVSVAPAEKADGCVIDTDCVSRSHRSDSGRKTQHISPPSLGLKANGVEMLILNVENFVRALRRPAKRRYQAINTDFQSLEPRIFLSAESVVMSDVSAETEADSTESIDSETDPLAVDVTTDTGTDPSTAIDSGVGGTVAMGGLPNFVNAYGGVEVVTGTVEWPGSESLLGGQIIVVNDANGDYLTEGLVNADGSFEIGDVYSYNVRLELYTDLFEHCDGVNVKLF